jgi:hypothetical protein
MSSGVVSQRTRMTASPALPASAAVSASWTIFPHAAPGEALSPRAGDLELGVLVETRMEELVELRGVDPRRRPRLVDQALAGHVHCGLDRGGGGALRRARLVEVELASSTVNSMSCMSR